MRPQPRLAQSVAPTRTIEVGDRVRVNSLGSTGRVLSLSDGSAEVQLGRLKTRVGVADLELQPEVDVPTRPQPRRTYVAPTSRAAPPMEIDLRGQRAEEVARELDQYIDDAYLSGMPMLRIIHGKGGGVLRRSSSSSCATTHW
ncbi:MAG: Smr/MutS family protein [Chloroflexia bacterium]